MAMHVLSKKKSGPRQSPPVKHTFKTLLFARVLTRANPKGKPRLTKQRKLTQPADLLAEHPEEFVTLNDETGAQVVQRVDYTKDARTGDQLRENTGVEQVLRLAAPVEPKHPH